MPQNSKILALSLFAVIIAFSCFAPISKALESVGSDSRIRTFIFGKNDVYRITTTFGYQTTIELEKTEKIKTISLGNSGYFKITPQKNTIFVKAIVPDVLTNMTVITDKRNYQIELSSVMESLAEIIYLVRFYYPESLEQNLSRPRNIVATLPEVAIPRNYTPPMIPQQAFPMPQSMQPQMQAPSPVMGKSYNYNYTLTGVENIAPSEVFDDGTRTYFKFFQSMQPNFRVVNFSGAEVPTSYTVNNGYYVVSTVAPQYNIYFGSQKVSIFNEKLSSGNGR